VMKLGLAISEVSKAEGKLADALWRIGERHKTDHDVFHVTKTLAKLERGHIDALTEHAERYDASVDEDAAEADERGLLDKAMEKSAELVGRRPEPSLLLLRDLRQLHELAARTSIEWVILGQGAQAAKDEELLSAVSECHDETLRTLKWTTYRIKEAAPQILAA
jgi:hypothetical protein